MALPELSNAALPTTQFPDGLASPEEVFLMWLLGLPDGVAASDAAAAQVAHLDRVRFRSPRGKRLRELFVAAAECSISNSRLS